MEGQGAKAAGTHLLCEQRPLPDELVVGRHLEGTQVHKQDVLAEVALGECGVGGDPS